jgi:hypothetical protein
MTGKVFGIFFMNQFTLSIMPLMCKPQPFPNKEQTILTYPAIECGTGEHAFMVVIGIISMIVCMLFVSYVAYGLFSMRKMKGAVTEHAGDGADVHKQHEFLERIAFMFEDYRLERYWFKALAMTQEMLLPLILVVFGTSLRLQFSGFCFCLSIAMAVWGLCWPLKSPIVNFMWLLAYNILLLGICLAQAGLPEPTDEDFTAAAQALFVMVTCLYIFIGFTITCGLLNLRRGAHGELFWINMLQYTPPLDKAKEVWTNSRMMTPDQLVEMVKEWQLYDMNCLIRVLCAIVPGGFSGKDLSVDPEVEHQFAIGLTHSEAAGAGLSTAAAEDIGKLEEIKKAST